VIFYNKPTKGKEIMKRKNVNMNLDEELVKMAKSEASKTRRSFSSFIEWLLDKYFKVKK
jgi:predicted DNA binding CopG/RHH family protein